MLFGPELYKAVRFWKFSSLLCSYHVSKRRATTASRRWRYWSCVQLEGFHLPNKESIAPQKSLEAGNCALKANLSIEAELSLDS